MQTAQDDPKVLIQTYVQSAMLEFDGMCASVAIQTLGQLFDTVIDTIVLDSGIGIRFSGSLGAARSVFAGTAQFIASVTRMYGVDKQQLPLIYTAAINA